MQMIEIPIGKSYEVSLRESLRDPAQSVAYFQAALQESQAEPELFQAVLHPSTRNCACVYGINGSAHAVGQGY